MSLIFTQPNEDVIISVHLPDKDESQYPQAKIYNSSNTLITTKNLAHQVDGYYMNTYVSGDVGIYAVLYTVYSDSGYSVINTDYPVEENDIWYNRKFGGSVSIGTMTDSIRKVDWSKVGKQVWLTDISDINRKDSAGKILKEKSEFDPKKDKVEVKIDFKQVLEAIENTKTEVDLTGVYKSIQDLKVQLGRSVDAIRKENNSAQIIQKINDIKIPKMPEIPKTDLSGVLQAIKNIKLPADKSQRIIDVVKREVGNIEHPEIENLKEVKGLVDIVRKELRKQKEALSHLDIKENKRIGLLAGALERELRRIENNINTNNRESFSKVLDDLELLIRK